MIEIHIADSDDITKVCMSLSIAGPHASGTDAANFELIVRGRCLVLCGRGGRKVRGGGGCSGCNCGGCEETAAGLLSHAESSRREKRVRGTFGVMFHCGLEFAQKEGQGEQE
jgi:hypothetical protein